MVVDAFQYHWFVGAERPDWFTDAVTHGLIKLFADRGCRIHTTSGLQMAQVGDFIVRGTHGEIYPVEREIFHTIYEPVEHLEPESSVPELCCVAGCQNRRHPLARSCVPHLTTNA